MADAYDTEGGDRPPFGLSGSALAPRSDIFICPFDLSHEIRKDRINEHLENCRSNYVLSQAAKGCMPSLVCCKYNDQHYVFAPELMFHEVLCEDQWKAHFILSDLENIFNKQLVVTEGASEQKWNYNDFLHHEMMCEEPLVLQPATVVNPIAVEEFQDPFEFLRKHKTSREEVNQEMEDLLHLGAGSQLAQDVEAPSENLSEDKADQQEVKSDDSDVESGRTEIYPINNVKKSRRRRKCKGCPSGMTNTIRRAYERLSVRFRKRNGKHQHSRRPHFRR